MCARHDDRVDQCPGNTQLMDWVPIVFIALKVLVFVPCMFFAIKWHYDQEKKQNALAMRTVLLSGAKIAAAFVVSLLVLGLSTFVLCRKLGLEF